MCLSAPGIYKTGIMLAGHLGTVWARDAAAPTSPPPRRTRACGTRARQALAWHTASPPPQHLSPADLASGINIFYQLAGGLRFLQGDDLAYKD